MKMLNKAKLSKFFQDLRASYWFVPALMVFAAIALSIATVWLDSQIPDSWHDNVLYVTLTRPDGARSILATVAGSMITVAGVTFSLTLLALSHATTQFGPRLLNNFMRDRGNQVTLGTFVSTFIYCLLVLRTVRSKQDTPESHGNAEWQYFEFVPHISVSVALLLALLSVAVLVYFIHHVPESIRLSNVVSKVGRQLGDSIHEMFPETIALPGPAGEPSDSCLDDSKQKIPEGFFEGAIAIEFDRTGYLQSVDDNRIFELATERNLTIFMKHRPGDFYSKFTELILVSPAENLSDPCKEELKSLFALGDHKTLPQNTMFAVDQLVEVAQRALSPGVNDPMTAMFCLDWLKAGLIELTRRQEPSAFRYDTKGDLRVFARRVGFQEVCHRIFDQLRPCVAADLNVSKHMMEVIRDVRRLADLEAQREVLDRYTTRLLASCEKSGFTAFDIQELRHTLNDPGAFSSHVAAHNS